MDLKLAGSVHSIDLIVFDCDGVLLDTVAAKIEAFRRWVPGAHVELREAFMGLIVLGFFSAGCSSSEDVTFSRSNLIQLCWVSVCQVQSLLPACVAAHHQSDTEPLAPKGIQ